MITLYVRIENGIQAMVWTAADPFPAEVLWIDMENTSAEEEEAIKRASGTHLPPQEDDWKNSMFNRIYKTETVSYMTAAVITKTGNEYPATRCITFVLSEQCLVTMRDISPTSFKNFARRLLEAPGDFISSSEVAGGLLEEMILRTAHNSELVMEEIDSLSHQIFGPRNKLEGRDVTTPMRKILQRLGAAADLNSKINASLHSLSRLLAFFRENQTDNHYLMRKLDVLMSDVRQLLQQNGFISDKITFLMDATLGMIDVEQNIIMKILSVFTVLLLPPTLIGSIYGMNSARMPGLDSPWGYPLALGVMAVCAAAPFLYFRKKRWL
jgi:magnesium transporter